MNDIELIGVSKVFSDNGREIKALDDVDLAIRPGESVAVVGPSGSGKSTLIKIIGLLYVPTKGRVIIDGTDVSTLNSRDKNSFRCTKFSYIMQSFAIINDDSVYENIVIPLRYSGVKRSEWKGRVSDAAKALGISDLLSSKSGKLSGGEKQRVAIARAMVCDQGIILADEPTGALDKDNKEIVADSLLNLNKSLGKTLVIVTHDEHIAAKCSRRIVLQNGSIDESGSVLNVGVKKRI